MVVSATFGGALEVPADTEVRVRGTSRRIGGEVPMSLLPEAFFEVRMRLATELGAAWLADVC